MRRTAQFWRPAFIGVILPVLLQSACAFDRLPRSFQAPNRSETSMQDLMKAPGRRIAEGKNTKPTGPLRVKTYYVDEIRLSPPMTITENGRTRTVDKVYRLTITGEQFPVRALMPVITIGDTDYIEVQEGEDLTRLSLLLYDRAALKDGATIQVSYGKDIKDMLTTLPEKLHMNKSR